MKEYKARYSGSKSLKFWERVNAIDDEANGEALFALGCVLQDIENRVLTYLRNSEIAQESRDGVVQK